MLDIREGAQQIYSDSPGNIYFLTGPEYGVKVEYINKLTSHYSGRVESRESIQELVSLFSQKALFPRVPSLYIVRYDRDFVSSLNDIVASKLNNLKVDGTIVALYDEDKQESKLDKFFPDKVLRINELSDTAMRKNLYKEFPDLSDMQLDRVLQLTKDLFEAKLICQSLMLLPASIRDGMKSKEFFQLFNYSNSYDSDRFKHHIKWMDYRSASTLAESYDGDVSYLFYDLLSILVTIIKEKSPGFKGFRDPNINQKWTLNQAIEMFNIVYHQLELIRSNSKYDPQLAISYSLLMLNFKLG